MSGVVGATAYGAAPAYSNSVDMEDASKAIEMVGGEGWFPDLTRPPLSQARLGMATSSFCIAVSLGRIVSAPPSRSVLSPRKSAAGEQRGKDVGDGCCKWLPHHHRWVPIPAGSSPWTPPPDPIPGRSTCLHLPACRRSGARTSRSTSRASAACQWPQRQARLCPDWRGCLPTESCQVKQHRILGYRAAASTVDGAMGPPLGADTGTESIPILVSFHFPPPCGNSLLCALVMRLPIGSCPPPPNPASLTAGSASPRHPGCSVCTADPPPRFGIRLPFTMQAWVQRRRYTVEGGSAAQLIKVLENHIVVLNLQDGG